MSDTERDLDFELTDELATFITDLHDSEINAGMQSFYDCGLRIWIGDELNGIAAAGRLEPREGTPAESERASTPAGVAA